MLVMEALQRPGVSRNRRGSLVLDGVRAMTSQGRIVVKLDPARVHRLVEAGVGRHYKGQINGWLEIGPGASAETCRQLIEESLRGLVPE
jgi:hypothetical protein